MTTALLKPAEFEAAIRAGGFATVYVIGNHSQGFVLFADDKQDPNEWHAVMADRHGKYQRRFKTMDTATLKLAEMGCQTFTVLHRGSRQDVEALP